MKMKVGVTCVVVIAGMAVILAASGDRKQNASSERVSQALNTIRLINTAELTERQEHGRYSSLAQLISTGALSATAKNRPQFADLHSLLNMQAPGELSAGFSTDMVLAADGSAYELAFIDKSACGPALFTNQSGLIYQGTVLGCARQAF